MQTQLQHSNFLQVQQFQGFSNFILVVWVFIFHYPVYL